MKAIVLALLLVASALDAQAKRDIPPTREFSIYLPGKQKPVKFDIAAIRQMKQDELGDIAIRNHKGEEKQVVKRVKGVLLKSFFDKAPIVTEKPKDLSELYIVLISSDGYRNVYSWNELFNTEIGNHVYVITEIDGQDIEHMPGAINVLSLKDSNTGSRYLRGLDKVEVRRAE